jgi:hypothetical protein
MSSQEFFDKIDFPWADHKQPLISDGNANDIRARKYDNLKHPQQWTEETVADLIVEAFESAGETRAIKLISERHNAALAAEQERADHNADVADSIARASRQVEDSLRQQVAAEREKGKGAIHELLAAVKWLLPRCDNLPSHRWNEFSNLIAKVEESTHNL